MVYFNKIIRNILKMVFIVFVFVSCSTSQESNKKESISLSESQIAFIHLKFVKKDGKINVQQISGELVPGQLKDDYSRDTVAIPGFILIKLLDSNEIALKRIILENPLEYEMEYVNADGQLERKMIYKDEAEMILRMQYNSGYYSLLLEILDDNLNTNTLFRNKLFFGEKDEN